MNKRYAQWYEDKNGIIHKKCTRCKKYYLLDQYNNHKIGKFGKNPWCKSCVKKYTKENKDRIKKYVKDKYKKLKHDPEFVKKNRKRAKEHYSKNKEEKLKYAREYRVNLENKEKIKEYLKNYARENKDILKTYNKNWRNENKEKLAKYIRDKKRNDPVFRIRTVITSQVSSALKNQGGSKNGISFFKAIGYTKVQLKEHLESLFDSSMNWNNYGVYWVVDHIIPRSFFRYKSLYDDDFKNCWAKENLRPLTKEENDKRNNRVQITNNMVEEIYGKTRSSEEIKQLKRRFCRDPKILCNASS